MFALIQVPNTFPLSLSIPEGISIEYVFLLLSFTMSITSLKIPVISRFNPVPNIASTTTSLLDTLSLKIVKFLFFIIFLKVF